MDERVPLYRLEPLHGWVGDSLWLFRMGAGFASILGSLALVLAIAGLHGVVSYSVSQRTFELGLRKALGARTSQVVALVIAKALRLGAVGILFGALLSWSAADVLSSLLYGISASDPGVFLAVAFLLVVVAVVAGLRPAMGAAAVDPAETLRNE